MPVGTSSCNLTCLGDSGSNWCSCSALRRLGGKEPVRRGSREGFAKSRNVSRSTRKAIPICDREQQKRRWNWSKNLVPSLPHTHCCATGDTCTQTRMQTYGIVLTELLLVLSRGKWFPLLTMYPLKRLGTGTPWITRYPLKWQGSWSLPSSCSPLALAAQQLVLVYATCQCDFWQNLIRTQLRMDRLLAKTNVQSILNGNITLYIQLQ